MPTEIDDATKRRLVYVKKLYLHGQEHISYQTEFDRMIAIHNLDNAVELLLKCVATQHNISFKRPIRVSFPDLWRAIDQKAPLLKKTEMFQLHDLRCNVQHWGVSPFSSEMVNRLSVYVSDFIREVLERIFGLDFDGLFMSSLVQDEILRKILTFAEEAFEKREYKKCMRFADAALNRSLRQQREESFGFFSSRIEEENTQEAIERIEDILSILTLGIDYMDYKRYKRFAPFAMWDEKEEAVGYSVPMIEYTDAEEKKLFSRENAFFSLNFVLDCILRWHL